MGLAFRYPTPLPSTTGWGAGYPDCQYDKIVPHPVFQGGVHRRIKKLTDLLVAECKQQGYVFHDGWSWGFGCRATKGGSGEVPSFHSWGLALDFNAPENPFGGAREDSDIAMNHRWVVKLMHEYGFFWLGPDIADWMHFHFCGSPQDADRMLAKAQTDGIGIARIGYRVGARSKVFNVLHNALAFLKRRLRHGKPGDDETIRVVKR